MRRYRFGLVYHQKGYNRILYHAGGFYLELAKDEPLHFLCRDIKELDNKLAIYPAMWRFFPDGRRKSLVYGERVTFKEMQKKRRALKKLYQAD